MPKLYTFEITARREVQVIAPDDMPEDELRRLVRAEINDLLVEEDPSLVTLGRADLDIEEAAEEEGAFVVDDDRDTLTTEPVEWIPNSAERDPA